jgi:hypothetical protein
MVTRLCNFNFDLDKDSKRYDNSMPTQAPFDTYAFAFNFWSLLTTERENLPGGIALANLEAPFLLANAAWYPKSGELQTVEAWYGKRGLPPAVIVPTLRDKELGRTLQESSFRLGETFCFSPLTTPSLLRLNHHAVEQASWLQSRATAELLAVHFGEAQLGSSIALILARAMQASKKIRNYLAYQDKAVAAMIAFEHNHILAGMLTTNPEIFQQTLLEEAGIFDFTAYAFAISDSARANSALCLERWSIA